jgi:hypothetical protein
MLIENIFLTLLHFLLYFLFVLLYFQDEISIIVISERKLKIKKQTSQKNVFKLVLILLIGIFFFLSFHASYKYF